MKDRYSVGIRRGNMIFSADYAFLDTDHPVIRKVRDNLLAGLAAQLHADIFIGDSFFNIYHAGSEARFHNHIQDVDRALGLEAQKFSLVYYVDVGDKAAEEPGILHLYDPDYAFDPQPGDVILFPSGSDHATSYSGVIDRMNIGINCYTY